MTGAVARAHADGFGKNTRDKLICATRTGHRNAKFVPPVKVTPGVASAEKELKLFIGRRGFGPGAVHEAVEGKLDFVTEFVGAQYDSVKGFANLRGALR